MLQGQWYKGRTRFFKNLTILNFICYTLIEGEIDQMTSKEVINYIEEIGIDKLYKSMQKYFSIVDEISDNLIEGDLLDEYQLSYFHDRLQGIYAKFYPIAQVLASYVQSTKANTKIVERDKLEKYRPQDSTILNAKSDASIKEIDNNYRDFNSYAQVASQLAIGCQSRLKRLTVSKGLKGVGFTGEVNKLEVKKYQQDNEQTFNEEGWEI